MKGVVLFAIATSVLLAGIMMAGCAVTGSTLTTAAYKGQTDVVKELLDRGADVDEKSGCGFGWDPNVTALTCAAHGGHMETVKMLVERGADVNARSNDGWTPLMSAAYAGHVRIAQFLLDNGADADVTMAALERWPLGKDGLKLLERLLSKQRPSRRPETLSTRPPQETSPAIQSDAGPPPSPAASDAVRSEAHDFGSYHALVIGNNDYNFLPKLHTAINDARSIAHLLRDSYGFTVKLLLNGNRADIIQTLNGYRQTLTPRDNFLIYYAGHGWLDKDADQGYWLPVNATRESQVEWISNNAITSEIRAIQAKHILVVADSCYSGKLARGLQITQKTPDHFVRISRKKARIVLSSGGLEPVMDQGGRGDHSVFASALIDSLNDNKGMVDGTSIFTKIREQVGWNADQVPEYSIIHKAGHDGGDFLFVRQK